MKNRLIGCLPKVGIRSAIVGTECPSAVCQAAALARYTQKDLPAFGVYDLYGFDPSNLCVDA